MYEKLFAEYGVTVGQILLTREDFSDRRRFLNARNCLEVLMRYGVIPVINENDTVSIDELRFGDNDMLAALVAGCIDVDLVIILSDIDGFYAGNPRENPDAELIELIEEITPDIEELAGGAGSRSATGGMISKLNAAKVTMHSGIPLVLAKATERGVISRIVRGDSLGTIFLPEGRLVNKKRWIAYGSTVQGKVFVDAGAARAILRHGKSLLPSGVTGVEGVFEMGNTVSIIGPGGGEIARGITSYSNEDIDKIKGLQTDEIEKVLGRKDYDEIIHRNNLVLDF